jgi:hypothetical protein
MDRQVAQVVSGNRNWSTNIQGTTSNYFAIRDWPPSIGRIFTDSEEKAGAAVCLLGQTVVNNLFGVRPAMGRAGDGALLTVAVAGAVGEELFFRGLLVPLIGVVASSIVFASLHQIRGASRWGWMLWAGIMGLLFGAIFAATGSLAGPLLAHAAINHHNLRFLRDNNPAAPSRPLGGLLRR